MAWRLAESLVKLRNQINSVAPKRNKASDGTIGDASHSAEGSGSQHNPNAQGVVCAFDITNDPANGMNVQSLADNIAASKDSRVRYMIFNGQIMVPTDGGWVWKSFGGDPHRSHLHISVWNDYDNSADWNIGKKEDKKMVEDNKVHFDTLSQIFYDMTGDKLSRQEFLNACNNRPWDEALRNLSASDRVKRWEQWALAGKNNKPVDNYTEVNEKLYRRK